MADCPLVMLDFVMGFDLFPATCGNTQRPSIGIKGHLT